VHPEVSAAACSSTSVFSVVTVDPTTGVANVSVAQQINGSAPRLGPGGAISLAQAF
jgi:hypothetical protein